MTLPLWLPDEMLAATGGVALGAALGPIGGVSIDTRTLKPGDLFVALRGDARDGHAFLTAARDAGAVAALVERGRDLPPGLAAIAVGDTLDGLRALAAAARARVKAGIVGVTGSVGKTSTKEMLALALGAQGPTHASAASYNNHWGVPLSLARMPRDTRWGVFEVGMNHAGEITPLTRLARPDVALITAIEPVHLEFFEDGLDGIADAKAEIFLGVPPSGAAILPADNPRAARLEAAARRLGIGRVLGFGAGDGARYRLNSAEIGPDDSVIGADFTGRLVRYRLNVPGRHMILNSLAALAAIDALGADPVAAARALAGFGAVAGRGRQVALVLAGGTATLIDESYNASPASVRAALAVLAGRAPGRGGRRIAVLGDMRELGPDGPALHRALAEPAARSGLGLVFTCGPLMRALHEALPAGLDAVWRPDAAALAPLVAASLKPGDLVTVKGSLGSRMAVVVEALKALGADNPKETAPC